MDTNQKSGLLNGANLSTGKGMHPASRPAEKMVEEKSLILIVDDLVKVRQAMESLLVGQGYQLEFACDGKEALQKASTLLPDLILLDVMMPNMDGFEVCRHLRADSRLAEVPIVLVTALDDQESRLKGIEAGADDFITKPFDRAELRARVKTITRLNRYGKLREEHQRLLEAYTELQLTYDATIEGWVRALDLRDKETEGHSQRVTHLTVHVARALDEGELHLYESAEHNRRVADMTIEMAESLGAGQDELQHLRRGALLHDIGKLGVPDSILLKPGPLTAEEWVVMRRHPIYAHEWLSPISYLLPALDIPYGHHEKWDGSGYPRGLREEEIPLAARIFALVDVWDALRSDRPYRSSWPKEKVAEHIRKLSGTHFDPRLVELFLTTAEAFDAAEAGKIKE